MPRSTDRLRLFDAVGTLLRTERFGRTLKEYETVGSTNTEALRWAARGAPEGSVVITEFQTAGRGRLGRKWEAAPGQNLMFSVVLCPVLPPQQLGLIMVAASVAVADAVASWTVPVQPTVKWPNDLLIDGKKCCGMLLESSLGESITPLVILGVGLNVNQTEFPEPIAVRATSLLLQTGRTIPRAALLADILLHLENRYRALESDGGASVRRAYEERLEGLGRTITVVQTVDAEPVRGTLLGITDTGALRLDTPNGVRIFHAGEVTTHNL